jgi:hypothetical protein
VLSPAFEVSELLPPFSKLNLLKYELRRVKNRKRRRNRGSNLILFAEMDSTQKLKAHKDVKARNKSARIDAALKFHAEYPDSL